MLTVGGKVYRNAAAKFWPSWVDELTERFPAFARAVLTFPSSRPLEPSMLHPAREWAESLADLAWVDLDREREEVLAEMTLLGPPAAVAVALYDREGNLLAPRFASEELDADLMPYLIVWLLRWADIPPERWNDPEVTGAFAAGDPERAFIYGFRFRLSHRPLSEGLLERSLSLEVRLTAIV